mgnify:CR=1 FL=1
MPLGDALLYYLPNFLAPRVLWDRLILSGFPTFADPQVLLWYPVSMFLSLFEVRSGFVISAYVMAFTAQNLDAEGTAEVTRLTSGSVDVRTSATSAIISGHE